MKLTAFILPTNNSLCAIDRKNNAMILTVEDLKKHLNIDHDEDDAYIEELIAVAEDAVESYLNKPISECIDAKGQLRPSIRHAARLLIGSWYANRESVVFSTPSELPDGVVALLLPLRRFVTPEEN